MAIDDVIAAIDEGDAEALTTLLADNDPNVLGEDGKAPIHKAAEGEAGCLEALIAHAGVDLNLKDSEGSTALMAAAAYGDVECVQKLVDAGCDQAATNEEGQTAVAIAEADGNNDVISILGGTVVEESKPEPELSLKPRRGSVSSESVDPNAKLDVSQLPQTEKSPEDSARIKAIIEGNFLFTSLDAKTLQVCINAMSEVSFAEGDLVIKQGDEGDYFYVVESGTLDCFVQKDPSLWLMQKAVANEAGDKGAKVTDYVAGHTFGELSLMYNTPRAATLVATSACTLLAMEVIPPPPPPLHTSHRRDSLSHAATLHAPRPSRTHLLLARPKSSPRPVPSRAVAPLPLPPPPSPPSLSRPPPTAAAARHLPLDCDGPNKGSRGGRSRARRSRARRFWCRRRPRRGRGADPGRRQRHHRRRRRARRGRLHQAAARRAGDAEEEQRLRALVMCAAVLLYEPLLCI